MEPIYYLFISGNYNIWLRRCDEFYGSEFGIKLLSSNSNITQALSNANYYASTFTTCDQTIRFSNFLIERLIDREQRLYIHQS